MVRSDHTALKNIIAILPRLAKAGDVTTESESIVAESNADVVSAVIRLDIVDVQFLNTELLEAPIHHRLLYASIHLNAFSRVTGSKHTLGDASEISNAFRRSHLLKVH
ncbi:hypothetical protein L2E82_15803 [Cichorium intybus]|uniref:Uncharacterized protein n=1 Tax=Cichorium intybus TaxID=13427 RepID=A0ACB9F484_CICIN|nr:hypothetical protein L2E82_15803 [Cichorium intybus]